MQRMPGSQRQKLDFSLRSLAAFARGILFRVTAGSWILSRAGTFAVAVVQIEELLRLGIVKNDVKPADWFLFCCLEGD